MRWIRAVTAWCLDEVHRGVSGGVHCIQYMAWDELCSVVYSTSSTGWAMDPAKLVNVVREPKKRL